MSKTETIERPAFATETHFAYLDAMRDTGVANMYGAGEWLRNAYPELDVTQSCAVLNYWIHTPMENR